MLSLSLSLSCLLSSAFSETTSDLPAMASSNNPSTTYPATPPTASRNSGGEYHQISMFDIFRNRIWKVPPLLRRHSNNKGKFDPRVVSIGPYHHGRRMFQPAEAIKPLVMQLFLDDPHCLSIISLRGGEDINKSIISYDNIRKLVPNSLRDHINRSSITCDNILQRVKGSVIYARSCYDEGSTDSYSDDEFTEMMILDGFFVLAALQSFPSDKIGFDLLVSSSLGQHALKWLVKDVTVLVENQIPFPILDLLMKSIFKDPEKGMQIIATHFSRMYSWKIVIPYSGVVNYEREVKASDITDRNPSHLMEVFWWCSYGLDHHQKKRQILEDNLSYLKGIEDSLYYFSVSELKGMGINVAPNTSTSPSEVDFKSGFLSGRLELPPWKCSDDDNREEANMMVYEFCSPDLDDLPATAYITFLKSLINHPEDVRELRSKYILLAPGVSDERVLEIVKETVTFGRDDYKVYNHVKLRIHDHCKRKWNTWMAELINNYFRNPWTFMALMAATFLLVLTFIQTYFTVKD